MIDLSHIRGIVFDLYDTLVYVDEAGPQRVRQEMLEELGVDPNAFGPAWREARDRRMAGCGGDLAGQMGEVLTDLGVRVSASKLREYAEKDIQALLAGAGLYGSVQPTLAELRRRGYRLALLSNCSYTGELVLTHLNMWAWFDVTVLSHQLGILKPDAGIFREASQRLGLQVEQCAFVGDGAFHELDAAHNVGMMAIRITQERQSPDYGSSNYADVEISDVAELLELLPGPVST